MKKYQIATFLLAFLFGTAQADYFVIMHSGNGIKDVSAAPFSFRVNDEGQWQNVAPGKTVYQRLKKSINRVEVKFGNTSRNAILASCHQVIPVGSSDTVKSGPNDDTNGYPAYSASGLIQSELPGVKNKKAVSFTLVALGNNYCESSASDCKLFDCFGG